MITRYKVKLKTFIERLGVTDVYITDDYENREIINNDINRPGLQLAGFYDYFEPSKVQLIGRQEITYLQHMSPELRRASIETYMSKEVAVLIFCHGTELLPEFLEFAAAYRINLFRTDRDTAEMMAVCIEILNEYLTSRITRHGVLLEVYGEGIFLMGESGIGKSETAVELLQRGHRLIADDAVEIRRSAANILIGTAPKLTQYYMELRGIGIINVRRLFGLSSVKTEQSIDLMIKMEEWRDGYMYDRIGLENHSEKILDVEVPYVTIPVKPGRNLAVIIEVAAMNNRQKRLGMDSAREFTEQINNFFESRQNQAGQQ